MINLYAEYIKERDGREFFQLEDTGFVTYSIHGDECYIEDMFVLKELRHLGHGKELLRHVTDVAKANGCKFLSSNVRPSQKSVASNSMLAQLSVGFKIHSIVGDSIIMIKELDHE